jgi:hypothetical protein
MSDTITKSAGADVPDAATMAVKSTSWVSIADLLTREVPVHWSEAIAVVAALCAALRERGDGLVPHPADVLINGAGGLAVRASEDGESDTAALARMLHNLFSTASAPAPLRLFVSSAISSERYQSVTAFAEALAAYEVPGREKLIQAVHDRWVATRTQALTAPAPQAAEPEQEQKPAAGSRAPASRVTRWVMAAAAVAVVTGGSAAGWYLAGGRPLSIPSLSLPSIPALASLSVPSAITDALGWLRGNAPDTTAAAEPDKTRPKPIRRTRSRASATPVLAKNSDLEAVSAAVLVEPTPVTASDTPSVTTALPDDIPAVASEPLAADQADNTPDDAADVIDPTVYSGTSLNVVPPVMMPRQITPPGELSAGIETTSTLELLVDVSGKVARVRLLSRPSPVLAAMLLSAAKTWNFRPAMSEGRPVKYRLLLDVSTTQR